MSPSHSTPAHDANGGMTECEFELTDSEYFFVELTARTGGGLTFDRAIRMDDGSLLEYFTASGSDPPGIEELADRTAGIESARILATADSRVSFQVHVTGACLARTIEGAGGIPHAIEAVDGVGRVVVRIPHSVDPQSVIRAVTEEHPSTTLVARRQFDRSMPLFDPVGFEELIRRELTDRQWEVLVTAVQQGYFECPRRSTGEEIATMLDISSATFSEHLRAAERKVFTRILDQEPSLEEQDA